MNIRFTESNWQRFFTHNKDTTWRTTIRKAGIYERIKGSRYKPIKTGWKLEINPTISKPFSALDEGDARHDGFSTLKEFQDELLRLNPHIEAGTVLYCHSAKIVEIGG